MRPARWPAAANLALDASVRRARQHSIFRRDPAFASLATQMRRQFVFDGCGANHPRVTHFDQRRAFGISEKAWRNADRPQFVGRAIICAGEGHSLPTNLLVLQAILYPGSLAPPAGFQVAPA